MNTNGIHLTTEQAGYFVQPAEVSNWVYAIENRIGPWVKSKGNKALWDIVLFFSQYQTIVKKPLSVYNRGTVLSLYACTIESYLYSKEVA